MRIRILYVLLLTVLFSSCNEYNNVLKSRDPELKYTYAKKYFDEKKYGRTATLLEEIVTVYSGSKKEQEVLFLLAQSYFYDKDYITATQYYTRYYNKFPKGDYTELARFNSAYGLFLSSPDARLDQTSTIRSLSEFKQFLEYFPQSEKAPEVMGFIAKLQDKLAYKELMASRLYFNLGLYMGNNYDACVVTAKEALKLYPFSPYSEELQIYIVRSKFELASNSIPEKRDERFRSMIDEHFNYKNMFPEGKFTSESERYYVQALKALGQDVDELTNESVQQ